MSGTFSGEHERSWIVYTWQTVYSILWGKSVSYPPLLLHFVFRWVYNARPIKSLPYLSDKHLLVERNNNGCRDEYTVVLNHYNQEKELEWSDHEVVKV